MIFIIAIFLANNPFSYLLVAAFTLGAISVSGVPYKLVWRAVKPLWFILLFTLAIHVFTTPGTELFPGNSSISAKKVSGTAWK